MLRLSPLFSVAVGPQPDDLRTSITRLSARRVCGYFISGSSECGPHGRRTNKTQRSEQAGERRGIEVPISGALRTLSS